MITREQMREMDRYAIEVIGIPSIVLMENAKHAMMKHLPQKEKYVVVAGTGNNGGDGLAMARDLWIDKKDVFVFWMGNHMSKDFAVQKRILENLHCPMENLQNEKQLLDRLTKDTCVIDAIFGTGLNSDIKGIQKHVIASLNHSDAFVFSVDIPSGIDANDGSIHGICVKADRTVTLHDLKAGMKALENVWVEPIGIPQQAVDAVLLKSKIDL